MYKPAFDTLQQGYGGVTELPKSNLVSLNYNKVTGGLLCEFGGPIVSHEISKPYTQRFFRTYFWFDQSSSQITHIKGLAVYARYDTDGQVSLLRQSESILIKYFDSNFDLEKPI